MSGSDAPQTVVPDAAVTQPLIEANGANMVDSDAPQQHISALAPTVGADEVENITQVRIDATPRLLSIPPEIRNEI